MAVEYPFISRWISLFSEREIAKKNEEKHRNCDYYHLFETFQDYLICVTLTH